MNNPTSPKGLRGALDFSTLASSLEKSAWGGGRRKIHYPVRFASTPSQSEGELRRIMRPSYIHQYSTMGVCLSMYNL